MQDTAGVIVKNVASLYAEKSIDSEQVTQAIMGQPVYVKKDEGDWLYVETWDTYHGWIQSQCVARYAFSPSRALMVTSLFTDALSTPDINGEIWIKLVITTTLELLSEEGSLFHAKLPDGCEAWVPRADARIVHTQQPLPLQPTGVELVRTAKRFLGVPYLWGGATPFGLDCSGLVQLVYKINGVTLLRDAHMQAADSRAVPIQKCELLPGDLVFFTNSDGKVTHVGMACGDGRFIHSRGGGFGVTINTLEDEPYHRSYWGTRRMVK